MKNLCLGTLSLALGSLLLTAATPPPAAAVPLILDESGIKNLRLETAVVEETDFAETVFALGRLAPLPSHLASVSSRTAGRVTRLLALPGERVAAGQPVLELESRQPGNPPPLLTLTAPLAGVVTTLSVRLGDSVEPEHALLEITDLSELLAVAQVPEHALSRLRPGTPARLKVVGLPDLELRATLERLGTTVDAQQGTVEAYFRLPNPDGQLRPGLRVEFILEVATRSGVLTVPRSAVQGEGAQRFVFVRDFRLANAFLKTPVVVGASNHESLEILSGLFPADEVVTRGAYSLSFAGGGSLSLKEALDAAHGHEHAEDGSELTPEARQKLAAQHAGHAHGTAEGHPALLWQIISTGLFLLLLLSLVRRRSEAGAPPSSTA